MAIMLVLETDQSADRAPPYNTLEDLEKALNESRRSESRLPRIIGTIPTLAWCNLPDGSKLGINRYNFKSA
jgi:hypothetical protein